MTVLILLLLYFIPMIHNYKFIQKEYYHPEGNSYGEIPQSFDYYATFTPGWNLIILFILVVIMGRSWKANDYIKKREWFKPKKPFN